MNRSIINYFTEEKKYSFKSLKDATFKRFSNGGWKSPFTPIKNPKAPNILKPKPDSNKKPITFDSFTK
ncbi:hypothetical protein HOG50_02455 [bacterium]|jgi:hypothetical protein|nr:hypothetical protein [bacterium]